MSIIIIPLLLQKLVTTISLYLGYCCDMTLTSFNFSTISMFVCLSGCTGNPQSQSARPCKTPCSLRTSCANCTSQAMECMWCSSTQRCVDSSAYVISFPYGQCLEWQTQDCTGKTEKYYCLFFYLLKSKRCCTLISCI